MKSAKSREAGIGRQAIVWIAAYLMALHTLIAAVAAVAPLQAAAAADFDPASFLCHGADAGGSAPAVPETTPKCLHCALCIFAGAPAIVPVQTQPGGGLRFAFIVLKPAAFAIGGSAHHARAGWSRAPPLSA